MKDVSLSPQASVADSARIGPGTKVWANAAIRDNAIVGEHCLVGRGAYIDREVRIGDRVKIEDNALIYFPAELADGVFIGPAAILTNDRHPRAVTPAGMLKEGSDWKPQGVHVGHGASIGAGAVVVAGVHIGEWALVGAGSVVVSNVQPHSLVLGAPAAHKGWVGKSGETLRADADDLVDPGNGDRYHLRDGQIQAIT